MINIFQFINRHFSLHLENVHITILFTLICILKKYCLLSFPLAWSHTYIKIYVHYNSSLYLARMNKIFITIYHHSIPVILSIFYMTGIFFMEQDGTGHNEIYKKSHPVQKNSMRMAQKSISLMLASSMKLQFCSGIDSWWGKFLVSCLWFEHRNLIIHRMLMQS